MNEFPLSLICPSLGQPQQPLAWSTPSFLAHLVHLCHNCRGERVISFLYIKPSVAPYYPQGKSQVSFDWRFGRPVIWPPHSSPASPLPSLPPAPQEPSLRLYPCLKTVSILLLCLVNSYASLEAQLKHVSLPPPQAEDPAASAFTGLPRAVSQDVVFAVGVP